jgi:hypothetical protein
MIDLSLHQGLGERQSFLANQRPAMPSRRGADQRVAHGATGNAQPSQLGAEIDRLRLVEKPGVGEVREQQPDHVARWLQSTESSDDGSSSVA